MGDGMLSLAADALLELGVDGFQGWVELGVSGVSAGVSFGGGGVGRGGGGFADGGLAGGFHGGVVASTDHGEESGTIGGAFLCFEGGDGFVEGVGEELTPHGTFRSSSGEANFVDPGAHFFN